MNARILTSAAVAALFCGMLPASAADPQMLNLVMPDAKVVAGVNVQQAMATPFGQYVLSLIAPQDQQIQNLATLIGFDPRRDVSELLVASTGAPAHAGLALARGSFDPAKIAAAATLAGAKSEVYGGVTILEQQPKLPADAPPVAVPMVGLAFLDSSLVVAGDLANVKAAIDRQHAAAILPANLLTQVNQWSLSQDAWVVDIAPLASLTPPAGAPKLPGGAQATAFQTIQQAAGGVKFGTIVVVTAQAQADTAENATAMAGVLQLLANLAQAQAAQNPGAAALLKSLTVTAQGNTLKIAMSLPQDQLQQVIKPKGTTLQVAPRRAQKKM
jgi:hypothetical protein